MLHISLDPSADSCRTSAPASRGMLLSQLRMFPLAGVSS